MRGLAIDPCGVSHSIRSDLFRTCESVFDLFRLCLRIEWRSF